MKNMKIFLLIISLLTFYLFTEKNQHLNEEKASISAIEDIQKPKFRSSFSAKNNEDANARGEYEFSKLKNPRTNRIPTNIRTKELKFASKLPKIKNLNKSLGSALVNSTWSARGPANVGGRTRALAIDLDFNGTSNKKILAGGVSGGIYLSLDDGASWQRTTSNASLPSVTCISQDPLNKNVWYYGTGERLGNSAGGNLQNYLGQGIFKSVDGGNNWTQLASTYQGGSLSQFDNLFDIVWNIGVHPQTSDIYTATIGAIKRSTDGGNSWSDILIGQDNQNFISQMTDVVIASNGYVYASLSRNGINLSQEQFGVFRSTNGTQFTNISPPGLVSDPFRIVIGQAPSDANIVYVLVQANQNGEVAQDHQLFRYNAGNNSWQDLSSSLPDEQGVSGNASFSSQGGYDLIVKVKPDNPEVVWIGGTNLYRSTNGGQSFTRVGGYNEPANYALYENSHSDMHSISFYPNNPNAMISGHDGGLSKASDVLQQPQIWTLLNNGYLTSQFYSVSIDPQVGNDNLIIGGLQDNGSWATESTNFADSWINMLSGDGGFSAISPGGSNQYVSVQNGPVIRYSFQNNQWFLSEVGPDAQNFLFIPPYLLDPNDANIMYMAAGDAVWRNSDLSGIPQGNQNATLINWIELTNSAIPNTQVTALSVSKQPSNRLYFGATDYQSSTFIIRVDNPAGNPQGVNITPAGLAGGSFPSSIGISPNNADEIIATFSNYGVQSIWYSNNGGNSWNDIEGNLAGQEGPSIRWATISSAGDYYLATSTGVYSTNSINNTNTIWTQEAPEVIGNVVVNMLALRPEDGFLVAGTHGRGVYSTKISSGGNAVADVNVSSLTLQSRPGESGNTSFVLSNSGEATLSYSIEVNGSFGQALPKSIGKQYVLHKANLTDSKYDRFRKKSNFKKSRTQPEHSNIYNVSKTNLPTPFREMTT